MAKRGHIHKCMKCRRTWVCKRQGMSKESRTYCPIQKKSLCDKCMEIVQYGD